MSSKVKAKEVSKWSMIIAGAWIGGLSLTKGFFPLFSIEEFGLSIREIIFSGFALAAIFTPVYFSIFLDKVKDLKLTGENKSTGRTYGGGQ